MMREIKSLQNEIVKRSAELKLKKYREATGTFFLEGKRAVEEALTADWHIEKLFCTEEYVQEVQRFKLPEESYLVDAKVMAKLAATENPQGVGAVVAIKKPVALQDFTLAQGMVLVLDGVRDPGNVGTIIRTADAAGVQAVILLEETADLYNPKVVRSTMGSLFHLPVFTGVGKTELIEWCHSKKVELWATSLEGAENLFATQWSTSTALVMGSEAEGVSQELLAAADKKVFIPMAGSAESLNVAVAAGICMFCKKRL